MIHWSSGEWKSPLLLIQLLYNDTRTGEDCYSFLFLGQRRERERESARERRRGWRRT